MAYCSPEMLVIAWAGGAILWKCASEPCEDVVDQAGWAPICTCMLDTGCGAAVEMCPEVLMRKSDTKDP
jgi:hypothetical protein